MKERTILLNGSTGRAAALATIGQLPSDASVEIVIRPAQTNRATAAQLNTLAMWERVVGNDAGNTPREVAELWALEYGIEGTDPATLPKAQMGAYLDWIRGWCSELGYELPGDRNC